MSRQLLLSDHLARAKDDDGMDRLAQLLVRNADDRHLLDGRGLANAFFTSVQNTFSPPVTIVSFTRSIRKR